jgi:hypothetical protein
MGGGGKKRRHDDGPGGSNLGGGEVCVKSWRFVDSRARADDSSTSENAAALRIAQWVKNRIPPVLGGGPWEVHASVEKLVNPNNSRLWGNDCFSLFAAVALYCKIDSRYQGVFDFSAKVQDLPILRKWVTNVVKVSKFEQFSKTKKTMPSGLLSRQEEQKGKQSGGKRARQS